MVRPAVRARHAIEAFDEKQFYLDEFRGRTLLLTLPTAALADDAALADLAALLRELLPNDTRVIVLVGHPDAGGGAGVVRRLQRRLGPRIFRHTTLPLFPQRESRAGAFAPVDATALRHPEQLNALLGTMWTALRRGPLFVGVVAGADGIATTRVAASVAARLRVHKLVLIEPQGGVVGADGKSLSFMDEAMLDTLLAAGQAEWLGLGTRRATLSAVRDALLAGVASVNLCTLDGTARELFTYEGSGTLFTLADYCKVERLGIDDFEEVERLIARGQREGILKVRTADQVANLLGHGYGATIGAHHLAGFCALLTAPYAAAHAGEVVGLYTITRFKGEGIGGRLVARVLADARAAGLAYVFACTTEERAQSFFERQGFHRVAAEDVPPVKWQDYDPRRKAHVAVFRLDLENAGA